MPDRDPPRADGTGDLQEHRDFADRWERARHLALYSRKGPFTPPPEGNNDGVIRSAEGFQIASTSGHEAAAAFFAMACNERPDERIFALTDRLSQTEADLVAATAERDAILADRDRLFKVAVDIYRDINFPTDRESFQIWTRLKAALEGTQDTGENT